MKGSNVITIPAELKNLVEPIQELVAVLDAALRSARGGHGVAYGDVEQRIAYASAGIERAAHVPVLEALEIDAPHVEIKGRKFSRVGYSNGTCYTMAGPVTICRALYREDGRRNARVVDAINVRTGAIGRGWLPQTAQAMAHFYQQGTPREAVETARTMGRLPYSRASFDRVAREVGEAWQPHQADIEDAMIEELEIPKNARSVSVALDRVSVPMEEPARRPVGRPRKDAAKRPCTRAFRMAYCGTVTIHDEDGNSLYTIRRGCMPQGDPEWLCAGMADDVTRLLEKRPSLRIKLLADGAPEMWNLLEPAFPPEVFGPVERGVDFYHLMEKLGPAAKALFGEDDTKPQLRRWKSRLFRTGRAAAEILAELDESGLEYAWRDNKQPVHEAMTYLENHDERMDYAAARRNGLPIGSGNVEATCKTLVATRMKRAGARWKHEMGEHVLQLRALALSDRWDLAFEKLHAQRRTAVRPAA